MSMQNYKRTLLLSAVSNYGAIIVSVAVGLISVPLGLHYFGAVRYGIWLVIGSILAYLEISNFGVSLATLTLIAQVPDSIHQRIILRRSIGLLLGISAVFILLILCVSRLFPAWIGILGKIPSSLHKEMATAALAVIILKLLQLPTTVFASTFSGLQQVYWNRVYGALFSISALGALILSILIGGNLLTLAIFTGLGGLFVGIVSGIHLFIANPNVRPRVTEKVADAPSSKVIFSSGIRFLVLQVAGLIILHTDNLVISYYIGPGAVTPYAITFKLFQTGLMMITAPFIALWPLYSQASGQHDWEWIQRMYNWSVLLLIILGGLVWIGGIIFSQTIINLWAGPAAYGGLVVAFALGGHIYISSYGISNSNLIGGLNPTNVVTVFAMVEAALNLGISLALVASLGIGGVALGTFIASLTVNTWFHPLYIRHRTKKRVNLKLETVLAHVLIVIFSVIFALFTVLYLPYGWCRFTVGIGVIAMYLIMSWRVIPNSLQNLIRDNIFRLPIIKDFCPIKER